MDGQLRRAVTPRTLKTIDLDANHPLTGPIEVRGARPGRRARRHAAPDRAAIGSDDRGDPRLRPARRPVPRAVPGPLGDRGRGRAVRRTAGHRDPRPAVPRLRGGGPLARSCSPRRRVAKRRWPAAAARFCRRSRGPPCPQRSRMRRRRCARSRRARTAATSTSPRSREGSRLLLPVHVPGALLSVGDVALRPGRGRGVRDRDRGRRDSVTLRGVAAAGRDAAAGARASRPSSTRSPRSRSERACFQTTGHPARPTTARTGHGRDRRGPARAARADRLARGRARADAASRPTSSPASPRTCASPKRSTFPTRWSPAAFRSTSSKERA